MCVLILLFAGCDSVGEQEEPEQEEPGQEELIREQLIGKWALVQKTLDTYVVTDAAQTIVDPFVHGQGGIVVEGTWFGRHIQDTLRYLAYDVYTHSLGHISLAAASNVMKEAGSSSPVSPTIWIKGVRRGEQDDYNYARVGAWTWSGHSLSLPLAFDAQTHTLSADSLVLERDDIDLVADGTLTAATVDLSPGDSGRVKSYETYAPEGYRSVFYTFEDSSFSAVVAGVQWISGRWRLEGNRLVFDKHDLNWRYLTFGSGRVSVEGDTLFYEGGEDFCQDRKPLIYDSPEECERVLEMAYGLREGTLRAVRWRLRTTFVRLEEAH